MSSNCRKRIEEYQDPDYCQPEAKKLKILETATDREEKIRMIIRREFSKEIRFKEEEIELIDHKLAQAKLLLKRVRYAAAMSYFTKKNLVYSENELKSEDSTIDESGLKLGQQSAIHPSLKKLLGKKPIDYEEILKTRSPRNAAKNARSTLIKLKKKEKPKPDCNEVDTNQVKVPRYIAPIKPDIQIEKLNSARGRNQTSHLIVVGNTSKYIGDEKWANGVTHKWLVYIKTKTAVDIEFMVSKVRFFLHPSYKPNDVIEVDSPPFQISRRGWGEFPIRIQLYFHDSVNQKPLQVYHNLVLDDKMTGLQTMGAETVVEIWLSLPPSISEKDGRESENEVASNSGQKSSVSQLPDDQQLPITQLCVKVEETETTSVPNHLFDNIENQETSTAPLNIKKDDKLILNDTPEAETHETIFANNENTLDKASSSRAVNLKKLDSCMESAQGSLIDINDTFKEATSTQIDSTLKTSIIGSTLKTSVISSKVQQVQQKKALFKCLDKNGKIIVVELQVDPNNPKSVKVIRNPNLTNLNKPTQSQTKNTSQHLQQTKLTLVSNTSSLLPLHKQSLNAGSINTTNKLIANETPAASSSSSFQLSHSPSQQTLEEKKIFPVKALAPNINSTNPPPLSIISNPLRSNPSTRISTPAKVIVSPNLTNIKVMEPLPKSTDTQKLTVSSHKKVIPSENQKLAISSNNIIIKNGKKIIRAKSHPKPKQESLLKPQISLLKVLQNKLINESARSAGTFRKRLPMRKPPLKRDYYKEVCRLFLRHRFETVRSAVEYLLRTMPLVNSLASKNEYSSMFPFVSESYEKLCSSSLPKRRANEWYRAKWLIRMLQKHPDLEKQESWYTKEVIIFGRRFGYTPTIISKNNGECLHKNPLKDMIKQHIKDEHSNNVTITLNKKINEFIQRYDELISNSIPPSIPSEYIDVVGDNEPLRVKVKQEPVRGENNKILLDVSKILECGGVFVSDTCRDIQIKLNQEEVIEGVLCSSAQLMLWQAMRSFLEDLIRRSFAIKPVAEQTSDLSTEQCVRSDELKRVISKTLHFQFLTNKHLGKKSGS